MTEATDTGAAPSASPEPTSAPSTGAETTAATTPDIYSSGSTEAAPATAPETTSTGSIINQLYTSEGGLAENYTDLLEQNGLGNLTNTVAKYKSADGLLKGAANLVNFAGKKVEGVIVPNEGSTEAEIAEYRQAIGVPESPTAYELQPENMPEGMDWDSELAGEWSNVFHEAGISQEQAQQISQAYSDITSKQLEQATAKLTEGATAEMQAQEASLKKQWGQDYNNNLQTAVDVAETVGFDMDNQSDMAALRHPKVMELLLNKAQSMQEGSFPKTGNPASSNWESPKAKADAIYQKYNGKINMALPEEQKAYAELRRAEYQFKR